MNLLVRLACGCWEDPNRRDGLLTLRMKLVLRRIGTSRKRSEAKDVRANFVRLRAELKDMRANSKQVRAKLKYMRARFARMRSKSMRMRSDLMRMRIDLGYGSRRKGNATNHL
jgi:hypothetical protein